MAPRVTQKLIGAVLPCSDAAKPVDATGQGKCAGELVTTMCYAGESVLPEAVTLRCIRFDAQAGRADDRAPCENSVTEPVSTKTQARIGCKIIAISGRATVAVALVERPDVCVGAAAGLGLTNKVDADKQGYVTDMAFDGLDFTFREEPARVCRGLVTTRRPMLKKINGGRSDDAECAQVRPLGAVETQLEQHLIGVLAEQRRRTAYLNRRY